MHGESTRPTEIEQCTPGDAAAALAALTDAVRPLAIGRTASAAAARGLLDVISHHGANSSPQQCIGLYVAVDRARRVARRSYGAGYDWEAWGEVSRLAASCLIAALRAMRAALSNRQRVHGSKAAQADVRVGGSA